MGSINLKNLSKKAINPQNTSGKVYVDLHLDITPETKTGVYTNSRNGIDIQADYDFEAIANSIRNIFNTRKKQRPLLPSFGCDLLMFVGEPITEMTTQKIESTIRNSIQNWEPRCQIETLLVTPNEEQNEYRVDLGISVNTIDKMQANITGYLNTENGFYYKGI